jgi:hypothetical protein
MGRNEPLVELLGNERDVKRLGGVCIASPGIHHNGLEALQACEIVNKGKGSNHSQTDPADQLCANAAMTPGYVQDDCLSARLQQTTGSQPIDEHSSSSGAAGVSVGLFESGTVADAIRVRPMRVDAPKRFDEVNRKHATELAPAISLLCSLLLLRHPSPHQPLLFVFIREEMAEHTK